MDSELEGSEEGSEKVPRSQNVCWGNKSGTPFVAVKKVAVVIANCFGKPPWFVRKW